MKVGDRVRYVRAIPAESHMVYEVAKIKTDEEGSWVILVEEDESAPDVEVAPGIMGGFGGWEQAEEFEAVV